MSQLDSFENYLYPPLEAHTTGHLKVSDLHSIYYELSGNKTGIPVLFVHGGPGAKSSPRHRQLFDPTAYNIILFDQRGCGNSIPAFSVEENNTWLLVEDMEKIRKHIGVEHWIVFGGSWGSTLSLVYAEKRIDRVLALVISGIFTFRDEEVNWLQQKGASFLFPDIWEKYLEPIPEAEQGNLSHAYHKRLTGDGHTEEEGLKCAKARAMWETAICQLRLNPEVVQAVADDTTSLQTCQIECHYFVNKGFLKPNQVLDDAYIIAQSGTPVTIVQGRYDILCPGKTAWELYKRLPKADFHWIDDAGHSTREIGTTKKLVEVFDKYKTILNKQASVL